MAQPPNRGTGPLARHTQHKKRNQPLVRQKIHVTVLSLGADIQFSAMALFLDRHLLPNVTRPDYAIFADVRSELPHVHQTVE